MRVLFVTSLALLLASQANAALITVGIRGIVTEQTGLASPSYSENPHVKVGTKIFALFAFEDAGTFGGGAQTYGLAFPGNSMDLRIGPHRYTKYSDFLDCWTGFDGCAEPTIFFLGNQFTGLRTTADTYSLKYGIGPDISTKGYTPDGVEYKSGLILNLGQYSFYEGPQFKAELSGDPVFIERDGSLIYGNKPDWFWPSVPEPASWAMMLAGFGMIGGAMRVRQAPLKIA